MSERLVRVLVGEEAGPINFGNIEGTAARKLATSVEEPEARPLVTTSAAMPYGPQEPPYDTALAGRAPGRAPGLEADRPGPIGSALPCFSAKADEDGGDPTGDNLPTLGNVRNGRLESL